MKVRTTYNDTKFKIGDKEFINKFIEFLQDKFPLKNDVKVMFLGKQIGSMTTGSRNDKSELKILANNRLNRDIMRTLAHEWVHEHQRNILKRPQGPNIGGKNEDEANAFAGRLVKMFEKKYPDLKHMMYESKGIENKVNLLTEQILISEKETIKEKLIVEMKKIKIEKLPYSYSSLQKFIDTKTMNIHYNKHYKGYVDKLNKALKDEDGDVELEEIIKSISKFDNTVRNNAGGAFNHALFWKMLSPKKQLPKGEVYKHIKKDFGNIKKMKDEFNQAAKDRFGSGWAWLYLSKDNKLKIMSTPNQDNPLMNVIKKGGFPILGLDVWEHSYYLKYQNKRDEYINNFWNVVNWEFVEELYLTRIKKKENKENLKESILINENKGVSKVLGIPTKTIESIYFSVYPECNGSNKTNGCIGMIKDQNCETGLGVIGGNFSEINYGGISDWSIINRFDTNGDVHKKILEYYNSDPDPKKGSLENWMKKNASDLFGNNGNKIKSLIDINANIIKRGNENEKYATEVLKNIFGENLESITQMCSGDVRDRKDGQDLEAKINGKEYFFQVKPVNFDNARIVNSERGMYYKIPISLPTDRYKEDKVDFYIFVDVSKQQYAIFYNEKKHISSEGGQYGGLQFYEPNMYNTNIEFKTLKPRKKPLTPKMERDRKTQIEYLKKMIEFYTNKLNDLGYTEDLSERKSFYVNKLVKLLK